MTTKIEFNQRPEVYSWRKVDEAAVRAALNLPVTELRYGYFTQSPTGVIGWWEAGYENYSTLNSFDGVSWQYNLSCQQLPDPQPVAAPPAPKIPPENTGDDEAFVDDEYYY